MLVWPRRDEVDRAIRRWASTEVGRHPEVLRLGYFGSYARGDWGVGSDIDLVAIVAVAKGPFERRSLSWDLASLPVAAELLVYGKDEWDRMLAEGRPFARRLSEETVWVYGAPIDPLRRRVT